MATTTRIDFHRVNVAKEGPVQWGYLVRFFCDGWTFGTAAYRVENDPPLKQGDGTTVPFDLETALAKLEACGWTVRRWETGARAWRGPATPIRTREQILRMRRRQSEHLWLTGGHPDPGMTTFIDYAFEG